MSNDFGRQFQESVNELHFSSGDKERMCQKLKQSQHKSEESEDAIMKKWSFGKVVAACAACFMITGVTAFATSKITFYTSSSKSDYDCKSIEEMSVVQNESLGKREDDMSGFPETLGSSYKFEGGNTVYVEGHDDSGNTVGSWRELSADYKNADGKLISLTLTDHSYEKSERVPSESRVIKEAVVNYNYDEYLLVPLGYELDEETKRRMEDDEHFYVTDGNNEVETRFWSSVAFEKNGITYILNTYDDVSGNELFSMAEELLNQ